MADHSYRWPTTSETGCNSWSFLLQAAMHSNIQFVVECSVQIVVQQRWQIPVQLARTQNKCALTSGVAEMQEMMTQHCTIFLLFTLIKKQSHARSLVSTASFMAALCHLINFVLLLIYYYYHALMRQSYMHAALRCDYLKITTYVTHSQHNKWWTFWQEIDVSSIHARNFMKMMHSEVVIICQ